MYPGDCVDSLPPILLTLTITWPQDAGLAKEEFKVAAQVNRDVRKTLLKAHAKKSSFHRMLKAANMQIFAGHHECSLMAYCQMLALTEHHSLN